MGQTPYLLDDEVDSQTHNWLLQKEAKGSYRILMESDGGFYINNPHQLPAANYQKTALPNRYLAMRTRHDFVSLYALSHPQWRCGTLSVAWRYVPKLQRYQRIQGTELIDLNNNGTGCYREFGIDTNNGNRPEYKAVQKKVLVRALPFFRMVDKTPTVKSVNQ